MPYPVSVTIAPQVADRNRVTTFFRLILAIPHLILVGGIDLGLAYRHDNTSTLGGEGGLLGAVAAFLAVISWFTILAAGTHIIGIRQFTAFYLRWRVRALAYFMLLVDPYPPYPQGLYEFAIGALRWRLRVEAYLLLLVDEYPPFSLT